MRAVRFFFEASFFVMLLIAVIFSLFVIGALALP